MFCHQTAGPITGEAYKRGAGNGGWGGGGGAYNWPFTVSYRKLFSLLSQITQTFQNTMLS